MAEQSAQATALTARSTQQSTPSKLSLARGFGVAAEGRPFAFGVGASSGLKTTMMFNKIV